MTSPDPLDFSRDEISAQAALVIDYATLMSDFARVRDDHGLAYAYRKALAHMRMAAAALQLIIDGHNNEASGEREKAA